MFKNYFLVAWRNLYRHPIFSLINIVGLALGLGFAILVLQYVNYEGSYDQQYNNAGNTYRITTASWVRGRDNVELYMPRTITEIKGKIPEVSHVATYTLPADYEVAVEDREFEEKLSFVNDDFFKIFDLSFLQGDRERAVAVPFTVVITESIAQKYFGSTNVVGKSMKVDGEQTFIVSGVIADFPKNTHLQNGLYASHTSASRRGFASDTSASPYRYRLSTYLQLEGGGADNVTKRLNEIYSEEWKARQEEFAARGRSRGAGNREPDSLAMQALPDIHFSDAQYEARQVEGKQQSVTKITYGMTTVIALVLAMLILGISCFNYVYLSIAQASRRGKEIAMRKVTGASRDQLFGQFICESLVLTLIAAAIALLIAWTVRPWVASFAEIEVVEFTFASLEFALMFAGLIVVTTVLAGLYPAVILSQISPLRVLFGGRNVLGRVRLRRALVVCQFGVAALLMMVTFFIYAQLTWVENAEMGFDTDNTIVVSPQSRLRGRESFASRADSLREELLQNPDIRVVSIADGGPLRFFGTANMEVKLEGQSEDDFVEMNSLGVDDHFANLYQPRLQAGRFLAADKYASDLTQRERWSIKSGGAVVLTATALNSLGILNAEDIIDKSLDVKVTGFRGWGASDDIHRFKVVGVVNDINLGTGSASIYPHVLMTSFSYPGYFAIRVSGNNTPEVMRHIESSFGNVFPGVKMRVNFLDDLYDRENRTLLRLGRGFAVGTLLTIFISCLGLYAIAAFTVERRTKEIGVRKVIGASVLGVVRLLLWDFTKPVLIAVVVALPVAILLISRLLEFFPTHVPLGAMIFVEAIVVTVLIAWLTVSSHTVRAATDNPSKALRYE